MASGQVIPSIILFTCLTTSCERRECWVVWSYLPVITNSALIFSLPAFVLFRAHFLEGVFTGEKLKKYDRPELPTLNPQTRWQINTRSGVRVSYVTHMYQDQIKLLKSCCIQWRAWRGCWCPQTQTSFKNCTQISHVQPWTNNIFVLNLLGNYWSFCFSLWYFCRY